MKIGKLAFRQPTSILIAALLAIILVFSLKGAKAEIDAPAPGLGKNVGPIRTDLAAVNSYNRVHRRSNVWMNITNWGYFGNSGENRNDAMDDPCRPGEWAPQCEYPGGTDIQYLFMGALWVGALIRAEGYEYPRVSVGMDGWLTVHEFWPGEGELHSQVNGIIERSTLPLDFDCLGNPISSFSDSAVSEQDFVCSYTDTLTESYFVDDDPQDGPHAPLGIKITQKSYAWTYNYAQNFIIIDWEIENIAGNYLKNLYIGLYIDADVGRKGNTERHTDDICGFQKMFYYERPDGELDSSVINTAWIADNDGRHNDNASGADFTCPAVTGVRVVRAPNPKLATSFNWWISNGDPDLDFGPAWREDGAPGGWTDVFGTPMGDVKKYFILSNGEFDYDQTYVRDEDYITLHPQIFRNRWTGEITDTKEWKIPGRDDETPQAMLDDLSNGYDTRYLLSWGPLGIFDHIDNAGNRIYRLNPGEKFSMTIGYVAGDNFHDRSNPQPTDEIIDPGRFNLNSVRYNADWAARVYDNPMIDTPIYDWGNDHDPAVVDLDGSQGDGILDTGDGWFGEDVGDDGLFAESIGDMAYYWEAGVRRQERYPGPDNGENDGHLSLFEDNIERPEALEYTRSNGMLDFGDGYPDFQGPPPPPAPDLGFLTAPTTVQITPDSFVVFDENFLNNNVVLTWNKFPSEDPVYLDPFSREWDFEGYRVYVSNTIIEKDFAFLDEFDRIDYSLYSAHDSLAWKPVENPDDLPMDTTVGGVDLFRKPVGKNLGVYGHQNMVFDSTNGNYYYIISDAHPMIPMYYSVTAYDYGDYKTGTQPLESAKIANAVYVAPSGSDKKPVMVVPNPYRANADYRTKHGGISWENRDDGTSEFFPQIDRRLYFYNLPKQCLIRIYTVAGDVVDMIPHNIEGDLNQDWNADYAESWDLNSRNQQQIVSGMYLFTVEDMTPENEGDIEVGKFVVIR